MFTVNVHTPGAEKAKSPYTGLDAAAAEKAFHKACQENEQAIIRYFKLDDRRPRLIAIMDNAASHAQRERIAAKAKAAADAAAQVEEARKAERIAAAKKALAEADAAGVLDEALAEVEAEQIEKEVMAGAAELELEQGEPLTGEDSE